MEIKDIRKKTGLTQRAFAQMYHIPLQTLKGWESKPGSKSYRKTPEYVCFMLEELVGRDFNLRSRALDRVENLIMAAHHSAGSASHWMRYLRKEFDGEKLKLTSEQIERLLACEELSMLQKIILKRACEEGTITNRHVIALNQKASTPMVDKLLGR